MKKIYLLLVATLTLGIVGGGCGKSDTPESAMQDIQTAIANRDRTLIESRVDVDKFLNSMYSDITTQIAANINKLHENYPDDPYFWNKPDFILKYNEAHRAFYMSFVEASVDAYFKPKDKVDSFVDVFAMQCANEFKNLCAAMNTKVNESQIDGNHAVILFEITGDSSPYGQFIDNMTFKFGFDKDKDDRWILTKIENMDELIYPLVDRAELVWPEYILSK